MGSVGGADVPEGALASLHHRGPDDQGEYRADGVWLGHTRLAVLDLDPRSKCPFTAGNVTLVFNGEMWNYRELRAILESHGRRFLTTGDTEVVAHALDQWGTEALGRFEGMFALVWHDRLTDEVFLARDRFGEMPLHMYRTGANPPALVFASELRGIKALGGDPARAEWVLPGTVVRVSSIDTEPEVTRWYDAPNRENGSYDRASAADELRRLLEKGCRERAISDVPVCTLLSGGIDSSAVLHHLKRHVPGLVAFTGAHDPKSQVAG